MSFGFFIPPILIAVCQDRGSWGSAQAVSTVDPEMRDDVHHQPLHPAYSIQSRNRRVKERKVPPVYFFLIHPRLLISVQRQSSINLNTEYIPHISQLTITIMNTQPQGSNNAGQEDYMDKGMLCPIFCPYCLLYPPGQTEGLLYCPYSTLTSHWTLHSPFSSPSPPPFIPPVLGQSPPLPAIHFPLLLSIFNRLINHLSGLDAVEKKFGGGSVDPAKQRGMNEKITDGARSVLEKATGYVVIF